MTEKMERNTRKEEEAESSMLNAPAAIFVKNISASYGKTAALIGVTIRVDAGSIYALLGPSGCGKTTLLACILARKKINSGELLVNNRLPEDRGSNQEELSVGYMPQDICLYQEFSIKETFQYFGALQRMTKNAIKAQMEELISMLELPEADRQVRNMSGGQRRRLSFSIALLHTPRILILDEPTVGVDPIVRSRIWNHLCALGKSGVTTLITTHYVEEARQADMVGIMRQGRLLVEEKPHELMRKFEVDTLEEAFLTLCMETAHLDEDGTESFSSNSKSDLDRKPRSCLFRSMPSFSNIRAMTKKNWLTTKRNLLMLYFIFLAPAILCTLDCIAVGQEPHTIPVALVNYESNCSRIFFDPAACQPALLGCHFLQSLNRSGGFVVENYATEESATIRTKTGELRALFVIPQNFSISFLKRVLDSDSFYKFIFWFGVSNEDEVSKDEKISISLDLSDPIWSGFLKQAIVTSLIRFEQDVSRLCGAKYDVNLDFSVMKSENSTIGDGSVDYREYITSAAVMLPIYFLAVARTADAFIAERSQGLLERTLVAGVLPVEIMVSFIASQFISVFIQVLIVMFAVFLVFGLPCRGDLVCYTILVMIQGLAGLCNGFFFSALCSSATDAILLAVVNLFFSLFLGGVIWPVEMMPYPWLESLSWYLPHTAALQGMRDITLRGWGLGAVCVQLGLVVSLGWCTVFFAASWLLMKAKLV